MVRRPTAEDTTCPAFTAQVGEEFLHLNKHRAVMTKFPDPLTSYVLKNFTSTSLSRKQSDGEAL